MTLPASGSSSGLGAEGGVVWVGVGWQTGKPLEAE